MSAFFAFLGQLASLNFSWIISFILGNLFWVMIFSCAVYFLFGERLFLIAFPVFVFAMWLWSDFEVLTGVGLFGAQVLLIYYISKIALLALTENIPQLKPHFIVVSSITGVIAIIAANLMA
ncbi:MAG: hypothetical protein QT03_C0001G0805 [archaeon GW2011_AR10]|uniref:Uncharacterized protein n=2 Tax=Candidatus Iainarchaeum sp. TaxID=3101447 RepID=A0A7J4IXZ4_9ARCH|nr:MAG: hypothetical protein QT03_C0001G0805 [archaeon GW2011_AR10]HIH08667.1 hypothetical protein [Candidatus Diapherotrites archaeon]